MACRRIVVVSETPGHFFIGVKGFDGGVDVSQGVAGFVQDGGQGADVFEVDVAQCDGCLHVQTR